MLKHWQACFTWIYWQKCRHKVLVIFKKQNKTNKALGVFICEAFRHLFYLGIYWKKLSSLVRQMTTRTYIAASSEPPVRCVPVDLTVPHLAAARRIVPCICSRRRSWSWSRYPRRTGRTPWCSTSPCPLVSWLHYASCRMWTESRRGHKISSEHSQGAAMTADPEGIQMAQKTSVSIFFFNFYNKIITF